MGWLTTTFMSSDCSMRRSGTSCPSASPLTMTRKPSCRARCGKCLSKFFEQRGWHCPPAMAYDFGDDWQHVLVHRLGAADDGREPGRCVAGEGRCPPEDCGGVRGYAEFLQATPILIMRRTERRFGGREAPSTRRRADPAAVKLTIRRSAGRRSRSVISLETVFTWER